MLLIDTLLKIGHFVKNSKQKSSWSYNDDCDLIIPEHWF